MVYDHSDQEGLVKLDKKQPQILTVQQKVFPLLMGQLKVLLHLFIQGQDAQIPDRHESSGFEKNKPEFLWILTNSPKPEVILCVSSYFTYFKITVSTVSIKSKLFFMMWLY